MEILKIVGIGIVTCISSILVKQIKPEFNILIIICGCVLILLCIINGLNTVFKGFSGISKLLKIDNEMFNKALNAYANDTQKNLNNLSSYAKKLRVYKKVTELMEVLLHV